MQSHSTLDIVLINQYFSAATSIIDVHAILHHSATSAMIIVASIPIIVFPLLICNAISISNLDADAIILSDYKARLGVTHPTT